MPGKANSSPLGRAVGIAVAALAVLLFALDRFTDLSVPYGYDDGGTATFVVGAAVALVALALVGWRVRNGLAD